MNFPHVFFESTVDIFYVCEKYTIFKFGFFFVKYYHKYLFKWWQIIGSSDHFKYPWLYYQVGSQTG